MIYIYIYIYMYIYIYILYIKNIHMTYFKNYQVTQVLSIFSLRQAYAKLTSQAWLRILTFLFAYAELTPSLRVKRTCKTVASEKLPGTLRVKRGCARRKKAIAYANLTPTFRVKRGAPRHGLPAASRLILEFFAYGTLKWCLRVAYGNFPPQLS